MRTSATETRVVEELRRANAELQRQLDERTAELNEKNERYALVSEAVAEGVYDWNVEQNTLFVSPRLMEMFGFEGVSLSSQDWFARVHEADRAVYRGTLRDCFKGVTPKVGCEYRILLHSGEYRWVEDHGIPIREATGRVIRLVGAVSDVTERKKADQALRETNRLNEALLGDLNAVIDTIDYGVLFMGPDLRARVINRAFREMWGIGDAFIAARPTMADLINFNRYTGLYDLPEAEFDAFVARRVEAIRVGDIDPIEMRRGDGKVLRYQGVVLPDGGRLLTYLDITDAKRREAELGEALEQQTATAEVLGVINASPGNLAPVFNAILEKAHRLCGATQGTLQLYDGTHFRAVATHGLRPEWAEAQYHPRPPTNAADDELLAGARLVHYPDLAALAEETGDARMRSAAASGVRTILRVPFRREGTLLGYISAYREVVKPFSEREIALLESFAAQAAIAIENARLINETREALEQQTATAEVLGVINSSPGDLVPVFDAMLEKAMRLCEGSCGSFMRYDGTLFHPMANRNLPQGLVEAAAEGLPAFPGGSFVQLVAGKPTVHLVDIAEAEAYRSGNRGYRALVDEGGAHTAIWIALRRDDALLGTFVIYRQEVRPFTDKQIALLQNFAAQAVIAMENARLITETREALEQQTATAEVLGVINASPGDLRPVFEAMVEKARRLCEADSGHLALPQDGDYRTAVVSAMSPEMEAVIRAVSYAPGRGTAVGRALLERRVVQIADIGADREHTARHAAADGLIHTILGVPLLREGEPIGAFGLSRRRVEPFTDRQIQLVRTFADQAVIAIENTRLITETREALEQQTATAEVLQVINSSPGDLVPVFDAMLERAVRLCEAASGVFWTYDGTGFRAMALHGVSDALVAAMRDTPRRMPTASLARIAAGENVVRDDDLHQNAGAERAIQLGGMRTGFLVALKKGDTLLGAIRIFRQDPRPFADKQIALLQNFAAQAVIAMENARLITETRERTHELQEALAYQTATGEVLRIVASSPDRLAPVFEAILERATELCGVKAANLYLHEDGVFRAAAARHPDPEMVADMIENPIRPGPGTAIYRAFTTKTPVHIPDIADDNAYGAGNPFRVRMVERGVRAVLIVPLVRGDEAIGVVTIYRPVPEPYSEAQIELVRTFADQAVIAIENARLFGELRAARDAAEAAYRDLQTAQSSLVQAQKMAALGQLTAGIAHEIKNPLNFVNNFAGLSTELLDELKEEVAPALARLGDDEREAIDETIQMLTGNLDKIAEHGRRADNIVKSMLEHSRGVSGEKRLVDLNALIDEALNLAYHGARAQDQSFNITLERDFAEALPPVELAPQEMTRVFLNLLGNGFYAAHKRALAKGDGAYRPTLRVTTREDGSTVEIAIRDNGTGISADIRDRLFQPFFTTKPTGEGTGLGLSISYDIVTQQHGGTLAVASEEGAYTEFTIRLPRG